MKKTASKHTTRKKKTIDPDKPLTAKEWKAMGPLMRGIDELPPAARRAVKRSLLGRPKLERPKERVTVRLDADVLEAFRATGAGWQTRLNALLREHMPR